MDHLISLAPVALLGVYMYAAFRKLNKAIEEQARRREKKEREEKIEIQKAKESFDLSEYLPPADDPNWKVMWDEGSTRFDYTTANDDRKFRIIWGSNISYLILPDRQAMDFTYPRNDSVKAYCAEVEENCYRRILKALKEQKEKEKGRL